MFEVFNDIYFVIYNLYYIGQNDDLYTRAKPIYRDGGNTFLTGSLCALSGLTFHI
jgi:hypothetical protein